MIAAGALVVAAGVLIGAASIGGVLVAPALTEAGGVALDRAIAATMFAFMATGLLAAATYHRRPQADVGARALFAMNLAALGGAALGAAAISIVPAAGIRGLIAIVAVASGLQGLHSLRSAAAGGERRLPGALPLALLGVAIGAGSALSGTGGPVLLLPVLLLIGVPVRAGITMAQVIQLPIALAATAVNAAQGRLDLPLAALVTLCLTIGAALGMAVAPRIPTRTLKRIVASGLVLLGLWYGSVALWR